MLDELDVSNIALIEKATLLPSDRLTVITGETGAGKTALLYACKVAMGYRAEKSFIRDGSQEAQVEARFFVTDPDGRIVEHVASRKIDRDGKGRIRLDGEMSTAGELSERIAPLMDLCSQHDQQLLLQSSSQREMLDLWAGQLVEEVLCEYKQALQAHKAKKQELESIIARGNSSAEEIERSRYVLSQIDEVSPSIEDFEQLKSYVDRASHAESLARSLDVAYKALSEDGGVLDRLAEAAGALGECTPFDSSCEQAVDSIREATYNLEDVQRSISSEMGNVDFSAAELDEAQRRISDYQSLMRRFGPQLEDVLKAKEEAIDVIELSEDMSSKVDQAESECQLALDVLSRCAQVLSDRRRQAAKGFAESVNSTMAFLEMGSAQIECLVDELAQDAWTEDGPNKVSFMFRPASGMQARPLSKIASGGELSRVMLSIHVALGNAAGSRTLIFDEIDAGVGGKTAIALGEVIKGLSDGNQVIVVTHLPQVAALADKHYLVTKAETDGIAFTKLREIEGAERIEEIARMLSGDITEKSLEHAEELLARTS